MITTNRRRQFGKVDDSIKIIHPKWWHVKFTTSADNKVVFNLNSDFSFSLKEIITAPDNADVEKSGRNIIATKKGSYDIYFTLSVSTNTSLYHALNCINVFRLPTPYSSNGYLRPLKAYAEGGAQNIITQVYLLSNYPPSGPSNGALDSTMVPYLVVYIPVGSLTNYISSSNTNWKALYNAGRLIEVKYKIIED